MNLQWIGIASSVLIMLGGTAVNVFLIGRWSGQWGEALRNITGAVAKIEKRLEDVEQQAHATDSRQELIDARLATAEAATGKFWEMRDAFIEMRTTVEIEGRSQRDKLDSVARSISVIERQLGNIAGGKTGVTTITTEGPGR